MKKNEKNAMCSYRLNGQYLLRILKELLPEYLGYSELDNMSGFRTFFFSERITDVNGQMQRFYPSKCFLNGKLHCCNMVSFFKMTGFLHEVNTETLILNLAISIFDIEAHRIY